LLLLEVGQAAAQVEVILEALEAVSAIKII
jgi:hypothetical protein